MLAQAWNRPGTAAGPASRALSSRLLAARPGRQPQAGRPAIWTWRRSRQPQPAGRRSVTAPLAGKPKSQSGGEPAQRKKGFLSGIRGFTGEVRGELAKVDFPDRYTGTLTSQIVDAGVKNVHTDHQDESPWIGVLLSLLPFVLLAVVLLLPVAATIAVA